MTPSQPLPASPSIIYGADNKPPIPHRPFSDPNRLAPEDAFYAHSSPRRQRHNDQYLALDGEVTGDSTSVRSIGSTRRRRGKDRGRSGSRRGKGVWKKLLWVKQKDYPDNYTDPPTFLSHLQRNPRLRPYDFWPLVADSTVIVQHISSVAIFVCSFVGIYQQRVSPVSVVSWGTAGSVLGWVLWDFWVGQEAASKAVPEPSSIYGDFMNGSALSGASSPISTTALTSLSTSDSGIGLGLTLTTSNLSPRKGHSHSYSQTSVSSGPSPLLSHHPSINHLYGPSATPNPTHLAHSRLATAKSAILIYIALLGLSPILKSLTKSTTSDSIWAMTCWLMCINIFFFDYSGGVGPVLSTKSTLRAPRLDSDSNDNAELNSGRIHISNTLPSPASDLANADPSSAEPDSCDIQFQPSPRASGHRSLLHFRRSQHELQGSDADEMLPVAAKATGKSPYRGRKRNAEDEDEEEEEELGVHVWEKNGNLVLEVPWFQGRTMGLMGWMFHLLLNCWALGMGFRSLR
ncbi:hypothetical protein OEA41_005780 [Lepraria neglecta]|uniref:Uncharacterized protein n=1 Tax=Lepraria neglecta TaxID=209136 RepID=A0AAD9Z7V5_9LECA|nr:hypothetical protein OEA41_005780 [Lepraria neglecta]